MPDLLLLIFEFIKTGLFAIGGGLATLPFLIEMSNKHPLWFSQEQLLNMVAISESTPGAIGINMSTYVGFHTSGIFGGILASLALVFPSIIIIILISKFIDKYQKNKYLQSVFEGLRPAVAGLIASAGFTVFRLFAYNTKTNEVNYIPIVLFVVFLVSTQLKPLKKLHPLVYIACGAVLGMVLGL